jgi:hypothetical protein
MHVGRGRDRAADGEQAQDQEVGEQAEQVGVGERGMQHRAHGVRA